MHRLLQDLHIAAALGAPLDTSAWPAPPGAPGGGGGGCTVPLMVGAIYAVPLMGSVWCLVSRCSAHANGKIVGTLSCLGRAEGSGAHTVPLAGSER